MTANVLIIVDMLNDFIDPAGVLYCGPTADEIVPFIQERLNAYRERGDLVVYLQDANEENDLEFEKFPKHAVNGTWGSQIIDVLQPRSEEKVIPKKRYSGFYGTNLSQVLEAVGAQRIEVVGVCTSICVMDTVGGLANRDYSITVPEKGVADFDAEFHSFALKRMAQLYGAQIV